jgi:HEPN domain-containing protein
LSPSPEQVEYAEVLLRRANGDLYVCSALSDDAEVDDGVLGFHAQQAVEKALKVALVHPGRPHNPKVAGSNPAPAI